ncbi:MAG TPA: bifunctional (p)ppGpp synthetase/guanosine-3',5'-bis(diphosphate) 3'-pyrophosphohydrolase [Ktedonobacteraceae bacterium]|nr:bifunctional (p)ppGpp synthetase/guanosine-3',5'-bis(diphosphate) 3'-pyrophosphohydrolase [Ktedonobacteraceae bacterium]
MIDTPITRQPVEKEPVDESAQELYTLVSTYMAPAEQEQVGRALQLARQTCEGKRGSRLIPPLEYALAVATILAQMHIDAIGVAAGLIFEGVDADLVSLEVVEAQLGPAVAHVVDSMQRLNILERKKQSVSQAQPEQERGRETRKQRTREGLRRRQAETVRKMFFAMAEDPRVVLLKLAYRLHAMRVGYSKLYDVDHQELQIMARETQEIYAPLAGRLGMSRLESELEDIAFAVLEPEKYAWLQSVIEAERKQWGAYVAQVCTILRDEMRKLGLKAEVSGRVKHLYSFYKKLKRSVGNDEKMESLQQADFSQIHDLVAFRILVESTSDCYLALGHVHSLWKPKEGRIKDFIANPKPNGYQALHTTVFCLDGQLVEIQIRTFEMHEMAEYGVAMHWHYKDVGDSASGSSKELLSWLRQLAEWQRELRATTSSDTEFVKAMRDEFLEEQIFVFTPKGEVKDLPVGSTPLDFAYRIHTQVGDHCAGARVTTESGSGDNEHLTTRMVPLDYELQSGDIVDIVTSRTAHPTRDWLNFARTAATKSKIRRYLKTYERDINIQIGRERLDRELKNLDREQKSLPIRDVAEIGEDAQETLSEAFNRESFDDLLVALGCEELRPRAVVLKMQELWGTEVKEEERPQPVVTRSLQSAQLQVAGVSGLLTTLANCCCPLPGDEIVGFISRGKGAVIHRADCKNIDRYRERERERLVNVSWTNMGQQRYLAPLIITARDRSGLIHDIAVEVAEAGVNMTSVNSHVPSGREQVIITITLEIENMEQMKRVLAKLERVKNVLSVERDLGQKRR